MEPVHVISIGLLAPGLPDWPLGRAVLRGEHAHDGGEWPSYAAGILAPNERRRVTPTIRLALKVADEACRGAGGHGVGLRSVFTTCCGDRKLTTSICEALSQPDPLVSPTQFHNSVHNAPSGYWAIATRSVAASTTISAFEASFSAGLLEAAVQVQAESAPVLLVAYDHPAPEPLARVTPVKTPFAVAMVLSPPGGPVTRNSLARLDMAITRGRDVCAMSDRGLEELRRENPAARSLPLLEAVARRIDRQVDLHYPGDQQLAVHVTSSASRREDAVGQSMSEAPCTIAGR